MAYGLVLILHIFVSLVLVVVILVQGGKGGLAETMGGSTAQSVLGTSAGTFFTRATSICAVLFMVTCITLTILGTRQTGSLMQRGGPPMLPMPVPVVPAPMDAAPTAMPDDSVTTAPVEAPAQP